MIGISIKKDAAQQAHSSVLARRIVILCLSLVFAISIAFTVVSLVNLSNVSSRNLQSTAGLTMRYLNYDVQNALLPALDLTNSVAAFVTEVRAAEMERILGDLLPTVPSVLKFTTVL